MEEEGRWKGGEGGGDGEEQGGRAGGEGGAEVGGKWGEGGGALVRRMSEMLAGNGREV